MLDLTTVQHNIEQWIKNFVEVPHPALGNWAPCPYARKARLDQDYEIRLGTDPYIDLLNLSKSGLGDKSVIIFVYDTQQWNQCDFSTSLKAVNMVHLLRNNLLALEDHPNDLELVNGVTMNQGTYALAITQSLSDLNEKAKLIAKKGFYNMWPEKYLTALFEHREDPRK